MTTPPYYPESGEEGALGILAQAFTGQEATGITGGLIERLARFLAGDPAGYITANSPSVVSPAILPDLPGAKSAILYVSGNSCNVRLDGGVPVAQADLFIAQGSYIILTGVPSIKGFQFVTIGGGTCTLYGCYFT